MKFFTLDDYNEGNLDEWTRFKQAYDASLAHLQELRARHPSDVWEIADPFLVDDALIAEIQFDRVKRGMKIVLRCGNLQIGYFDLILRYENVEISHESEFVLATVARATKTSVEYWGHDCYRHEIDLTDDGRFDHHFLFHPGLSLTLRCTSLTWERIPRPGRKLPRTRDRFPGGPVTPPSSN